MPSHRKKSRPTRTQSTQSLGKQSKKTDPSAIWRASPTPPTPWDEEEEDQDFGIEIVGEEMGYEEQIKYEVKWKGWQRPDGTSTTWEGPDTISEPLPTQAWIDKRLAALPETTDVRLWGTTDIVNTRTRERRQGYARQTQQQLAAYQDETDGLMRRMEELREENSELLGRKGKGKQTQTQPVPLPRRSQPPNTQVQADPSARRIPPVQVNAEAGPSRFPSAPAPAPPLPKARPSAPTPLSKLKPKAKPLSRTPVPSSSSTPSLLQVLPTPAPKPPHARKPLPLQLPSAPQAALPPDSVRTGSAASRSTSKPTTTNANSKPPPPTNSISKQTTKLSNSKTPATTSTSTSTPTRRRSPSIISISSDGSDGIEVIDGFGDASKPPPVTRSASDAGAGEANSSANANANAKGKRKASSPPAEPQPPPTRIKVERMMKVTAERVAPASEEDKEPEVEVDLIRRPRGKGTLNNNATPTSAPRPPRVSLRTLLDSRKVEVEAMMRRLNDAAPTSALASSSKSTLGPTPSTTSLSTSRDGEGEGEVDLMRRPRGKGTLRNTTLMSAPASSSQLKSTLGSAPSTSSLSNSREGKGEVDLIRRPRGKGTLRNATPMSAPAPASSSMGLVRANTAPDVTTPPQIKRAVMSAYASTSTAAPARGLKRKASISSAATSTPNTSYVPSLYWDPDGDVDLMRRPKRARGTDADAEADSDAEPKVEEEEESESDEGNKGKVTASSPRTSRRLRGANVDLDDEGVVCACGTLLPPRDTRRDTRPWDMCHLCHAGERGREELARRNSEREEGLEHASNYPPPRSDSLGVTTLRGSSTTSTARHPPPPPPLYPSSRQTCRKSTGGKPGGSSRSASVATVSNASTSSTVMSIPPRRTRSRIFPAEAETMEINAQNFKSKVLVRPPPPQQLSDSLWKKGKMPETKSRRLQIETEWSTIAQSCDGAAGITFVNDKDDEEVPPSIMRVDFVYLEDNYHASSNLKLNTRPDAATPLVPDELVDYMTFCRCTTDCVFEDDNCCQDREELAGQGLHGFAYTNSLFNFTYALHHVVVECGPFCQCPVTCGNRVAQRPRQFPIEIFKVSSDCGWGVRTPVDIAKGTVLGLYTGELITRNRAEKLTGKRKEYCFDLDYNDHAEPKPKNLYTVDSYRYGNWTRFINHSCEPNLRVQPVVYDTIPQQNIAFLAFIASDDIPAQQEFTFDYDREEQNDYLTALYEGRTPEPPPPDATECRCGADRCRRWVRT
ncbi:hypothetical protein B0H16DRAFT_1580746 [Mycena metata]|uniref:SET domain-containing protein n=1 Tax=Mycena metata TaxID=1033252 RepID=A0AAD7I0X1_9AGAR|nr:hypothetical protein B0H16DRAFT_1580746 [Mycena metata]